MDEQQMYTLGKCGKIIETKINMTYMCVLVLYMYICAVCRSCTQNMIHVHVFLIIKL